MALPQVRVLLNNSHNPFFRSCSPRSGCDTPLKVSRLELHDSHGLTIQRLSEALPLGSRPCASVCGLRPLSDQSVWFRRVGRQALFLCPCCEPSPPWTCGSGGRNGSICRPFEGNPFGLPTSFLPAAQALRTHDAENAATSGSPACGGGGEVQLVSLTTDPDFDTPEVLSQYARKFQADTQTWKFLTGTKEEIVRVSTQEWLLVMLEKGEAERESPNDIFPHSTLTVLMDGLGRIRGTYEILKRVSWKKPLSTCNGCCKRHLNLVENDYRPCNFKTFH